MAGSRTHFSGSRRSRACFHVRAFMTAHNLPDVTVVADAGMVSDANQKAIEDAGLSFILGARVPGIPYPVAQWRREHPGEQIGDGQVFTLRWPALADSGRRDQPVTTSSCWARIHDRGGELRLLVSARGCHAAILYSWVSPPRTCFRRIWCSARLIASGGRVSA